MKKHGRWPALMLAGAMMVSSVANVGLMPNARAAGDSEYPNLALSKPATSKNDEGYGLVASNAVDGSCTGDNANSRWSSAMSSGETWLMVDLENYATIHSFQVVWVEPHANPYKIQFSANGTDWVDAYVDDDGVNVDEHTEHTKDVNGGQRFDPHTLTYTLDQPLEGMRYARMWANKQGGGYPCIGVYEFRVFGEEGEVVQELLNKDPANLALGKTASAYASPISYWGPDKMTDGIINRTASKGDQSRWSSEAGAPGWVQIDLRQPQEFQIINLEWEQPVVEDYHIEVSDNGSDWTTVYTAEKNTEGYPVSDRVTLDAPVTARYVKVAIDKLKEGAYPSLSLYEVEIYTPDVSGTDKTTNKDISVSNGTEANAIIDDNLETVWQGASGDFFTVDLGASLKYNRYQIQWATAAAYHVEVSSDGKNWEGVYTTSEASEAATEVTLDLAYNQRYVRVTLDGEGAVKEFSLHQDLDFVNVFDQAKQLLDGITIDEDDTSLTLPEKFPQSIAVTYLGTDYEQVIDADRNIIRPIVDTTVAVGFRLESKNQPDNYQLYEVSVEVPGLHSADESQNEKPKVIPELQQWFGTTGDFTIRDGARILVDPALSEEYITMANRFADDYEDIVGKTIAVERGNNPTAGDFYFVASDIPFDEEAYDLHIGEYITIEASHQTGAYWSTRSILQILKQTGDTIPQGDVRDYPKYKVRGLSMDIARRYVPLYFLEDWISQMSWYKMNDFNAHMSDNTFDLSFGGFPLESDVPNLTNPEGMYYTKDEFRQFQVDAKEQGVMVVPEFDTPGHSLPFTEARPDLARPNKKEYLDVQNPETAPFVQSVFDEYLDGEDPVFLEDAVINIGTDEYKGGGQEEKEAFRAYQDTMLKYILEKGHTPRAWGSQTENHGTTPVQVEGVQLYMWYTGYANAKEMYDLGYQMININDGDTYIVPGAGYYYDYLNKGHIYNNFDPSNIYRSFKVPAGDPQILGGSYALWNDKTGGSDNGTADMETLDRLFDALPVVAAKTWGDGKDNTLSELEAIVDETGYAPNTNPTYEVETKNDTVLSYDFDEDAKTQDNSMNDYDLVSEGENVAYEEGHDGTALTLKGGSSYVETPLEDKGLNTTLDFWVKRDANSGDDEQILFESEIGQIKAVQKETGNLGFSREARDYSFNYALPKGEWVHITMVMEFTKTTLYVNGEKIQTLERTEEGGNKWASLVTPLMRIGSQTKAFQGQIDSLRLYDFAATADQVGNLSVDLYDEASGVRVHGDVGVLPSDTVIQVTDQSSNEKFLEMAESILKGSSINAQSIRLTSGEEAVTPNGEIMISMPVGEMDQDTLALYEFRQDGTYEEVTFTVNNGMACWTSNHANGDDTAFVLLSKTEDTKPANKTLLQKTYEYALTLSTEGVTDTAKAAFEKALANAKVVLDNQKATQEEVNSAWDALLKGIWGLGLTQGDKTMLEQLIAKAESMIADQDKYVQDNWQMLVDALDQAKKVDADGDAMEEDIQPAAEALLNAILAQRFKADKSILEDLINKAESMDLSGYTAASVATFRTALANAQAVMADNSLTEDDQATVDAAVEKLSKAIDGLTAGGAPEATDKPNATDKPQTTEKPENNIPQTGDHAYVTFWVVLSAACASALVAVGAVRSKKRSRR